MDAAPNERFDQPVNPDGYRESGDRAEKSRRAAAEFNRQVDERWEVGVRYAHHLRDTGVALDVARLLMRGWHSVYVERYTHPLDIRFSVERAVGCVDRVYSGQAGPIGPQPKDERQVLLLARARDWLLALLDGKAMRWDQILVDCVNVSPTGTVTSKFTDGTLVRARKGILRSVAGPICSDGTRLRGTYWLRADQAGTPEALMQIIDATRDAGLHLPL